MHSTCSIETEPPFASAKIILGAGKWRPCRLASQVSNLNSIRSANVDSTMVGCLITVYGGILIPKWAATWGTLAKPQLNRVPTNLNYSCSATMGSWRERNFYPCIHGIIPIWISHRTSLHVAIPAQRCNWNEQEESHYIVHKTDGCSWLSFDFLSTLQLCMSLPANGSIACPCARLKIEQKRWTQPLKMWLCTAFTLHAFCRQNLSLVVNVPSPICWLNCECLKSICWLICEPDGLSVKRRQNADDQYKVILKNDKPQTNDSDEKSEGDRPNYQHHLLSNRQVRAFLQLPSDMSDCQVPHSFQMKK